jgi:hypothetical protein
MALQAHKRGRAYKDQNGQPLPLLPYQTKEAAN